MGTGAAKPQLAHKHLRLDTKVLKRLQKAMSAKTETETVNRAMKMALSEYERERLVDEAHWALQQSGVVIRDVFGSLEK